MSAADQRTGTGASRVRRLLSRALLVAGGALAGTAAAWALSAAPASAQTPVDHDDAVTGISQAAAPLGGALPEVGLTPVEQTRVGQAVQDLDAALRSPQVREPQPPDLNRVAEEIRGAVDQVGVLFRQPVLPRLVPTAPAAEAPAAQHRQPVTETTPATTAVPVTAGTPVVHGVFAQWSRTWLDAPRHAVAAVPTDSGSSFPGDPSGLPSLPFAPPSGVPAHCTCGGDGAGSAGGGSGPFAAVSTSALDSAVARALLPATERNTVMPGKQPGITPD
ncbi:hypothetical protein ACFFSW_20475 [Saccharothrix longispora]|uniref:Secreted protein n=1 Tax=Saccharothrix longispora TaxID=33920 RepID=A0ABU1Q399_9PSEU|nr:hypothetical protein [Saccharothrix longispora]MDR6597348.1 hypothetical protein [Saccharothrix longispora]